MSVTAAQTFIRTQVKDSPAQKSTIAVYRLNEILYTYKEEFQATFHSERFNDFKTMLHTLAVGRKYTTNKNLSTNKQNKLYIVLRQNITETIKGLESKELTNIFTKFRDGLKGTSHNWFYDIISAYPTEVATDVDESLNNNLFGALSLCAAK